MKSVLTFTERINTGSEDEIVAEETAGDQDQSVITQGQLGAGNVIDVHEDKKIDLSQISFTEEEKNL